MDDILDHAVTSSAAPEMQTRGPKKPGRGSALTKREIALCLQLAESGKNTVEIAQILGCHDSTVGRTLDAWSDSRGYARRLLEAKADRLAHTVIATKNADVALRALGKLDVVREDVQNTGNSMVVVLGSIGQSLEPPVLSRLSPIKTGADLETAGTFTLPVPSESA